MIPLLSPEINSECTSRWEDKQPKKVISVRMSTGAAYDIAVSIINREPWSGVRSDPAEARRARQSHPENSMACEIYDVGHPEVPSWNPDTTSVALANHSDSVPVGRLIKAS